MNNPFKRLWIRLRWILRGLKRHLNSRKKENPASEKQEKKTPQTNGKQTKLQEASKKCRSIWKPLLKLLISLTEIYQLMKLLVNLIRKNWDSSAKS